MSHAQPSAVRYVVVWLALLALTALSWLLSRAHLGSTDIAVALVIAGERFSIVIIPCVAVFFIGLLVILTAVDVATRHTFPSSPLPNVDELPATAD